LHLLDKEAYKKATRYLRMIAHVIIKEAALQDVNAKTMQLNQQSELDAHIYTIDLKSIWSLWHTINDAKSPEAKQTSKSALKSLCDECYTYRRFMMQRLPGRHPTPYISADLH
jgi:hypothetical protein